MERNITNQINRLAARYGVCWPILI